MPTDNTRPRLDLPSMILGAALVLLGVWLGQTDSDNTASAQTTVMGSFSIFDSGNPAIITASNDGKTLYVWSLGNTHETISNARQPKFIKSLTTKD